MGKLKTALTKLWSAAKTTGTHIPLCDADGTPVGMATVSAVASQLANENGLARTAEVFVAVWDNSNSRINYRNPRDIGVDTNKAIGAAIIHNGRTFVVAMTNCSNSNMKWSANTNATGRELLSYHDAMSDYEGESKTDSIVTALTTNATAANACRSYYATNFTSDNVYVGAGNWYLPSLGEVLVVMSHLAEVNAIMELIGGAAITTSMLSSTEASATQAWGMTVEGAFVATTKTTATHIVRAFINAN